jgi:hypothetical protein
MNAIAFKIKLDTDTIHLDNVERFIGKDVMVTIIEMPIEEEKPQKREWKFAGKGQTDIDIDKLNLRDFAYD